MATTATATGLRDKAVTIQHGTVTKGASGAPIETFVDTTPPVWMAQTQARGDEALQASGEVSARAVHKWTLPDLPAMDPDRVDVVHERRLSYAGRLYDITAAYRSAPGELTLLTLVKADDGS
jgi:head-tail adaptor